MQPTYLSVQEAQKILEKFVESGLAPKNPDTAKLRRACQKFYDGLDLWTQEKITVQWLYLQYIRSG